MNVVLWILVVLVILAVAFLANRWLRGRHRGGVIATPPSRGTTDRDGGT
jgi:hypothetical protein